MSVGKRPRGAMDCVAVIALVLLCIVSVSLGNELRDQIVDLEASIQLLRSQGSYNTALESARKLRVLLGERRETKQHEIRQAELLVSLLERVSRLPADSQREFAIADSLNGTVAELFENHQFASGLKVAEKRFQIVEAVLGPTDPVTAEALQNVASFQIKLGNTEDATTTLREALQTLEQCLDADDPALAVVLDQLSGLLCVEAPEASVALSRQALAIGLRVFGSESEDVLLGRNNLAFSLIAAGELLEAEELVRESFKIACKKWGRDGTSTAFYGANLAVMCEMNQKLGESEELLESALEINRKGTLDIGKVALNLQNLSGLKVKLGKYTEAESLARKSAVAWAQADTTGTYHLNPWLHTHLAAAQLLQGKGAAAERSFVEALEGFKEIKNTGGASLRASEGLARTLRMRGANEEARRVMLRAAAVFEDERRLSDIARASVVPSPYPELAAVQLALGDSSGAWESVCRHFGRSLFEVSVIRKLEIADSSRASLAAALTDATARYEALRTVGAGVDVTLRDKAEAQVNRLASALALERGRTKFGVGPLTTDPPLLADLQKTLDAATAIIGWLDIPFGNKVAESWGYVVRNRGPVRWEKLSTKVGVSNALWAAAALEGLATTVTASEEELARTIYDTRFLALTKHLGGATAIVVIPSGSMLGFPIEVLRDAAGRRVVEKFAVTYTPSLGIWSWLRERPPASIDMRRALFIGDPECTSTDAPLDVNGGAGDTSNLIASLSPVWKGLPRGIPSRSSKALDALPALPAARHEVESCSSLFSRSETFVGQSATEQLLVDKVRRGILREYRVLHFATHAVIVDQSPGASALVLTRRGLPDPVGAAIRGERVFDGLLTAEEVIREWNLNADLVVLSGCETGLGKQVGGEGYLGLSTAFLVAGARSLLVSLWRVEDRATELLIRRFYENWLGVDHANPERIGRPRLTKGAALQEAKSWIRTYEDPAGVRPYENPLNWAGFILLGNSE